MTKKKGPPKPVLPLPPQPATILEAAREIGTPAAFRLWCVLAVIPRRRLEDGERALGRFLGIFRPHLRRMLLTLQDAGYVKLDYPPKEKGVPVTQPGRVVILRPPLLVGDDQFVKLGRSGEAPGAFSERGDRSEMRRRIESSRAHTLFGRPVAPTAKRAPVADDERGDADS